MFTPVRENNNPMPRIKAEKKNITIKSKEEVIG
jgi:hypothetical protein